MPNLTKTENKILILSREGKGLEEICEGLKDDGVNFRTVQIVRNQFPGEFRGPGRPEKEGGKKVNVSMRILPETKQKIAAEAEKQGVKFGTVAGGLLDDWGLV